MILDGLALALLLLGAWRGWSTGALTQGARLTLLGLAALVARALTPSLAGFYLGVTEGATVESAVGSTFLGAFVVLLAVLTLALRGFTADLSHASYRGGADRFVAAGVGSLKGLVLAWVLAVGLLQVALGGGGGARGWETSRLGRFAVDKDFLDPVVEQVVLQREATDRPVVRGWERRATED